MPDSTEATSPAATGDAKPAASAVEKSGSGNLTTGQAAARLQASAQLFADAAKPSPAAAEETAPETPAEAGEPAPTNSAAEAPAASVARTGDDAEPEESEAEATGETDPVPSQSTSKFTPEQQRIFDKRVGKEMGKRQAAEARLQETEARLKELEGRAIAPAPPATTTPPVPFSGPSPLAQYNDLASLGQLQLQAKEAVRWADQVLDTPRAWKTKTETDPDSGEENSYKVTQIGDKVYTEAEVKGIMRRAKVTLEDDIPARVQYVNVRSQALSAAHQEFPFLTDKSSPDYHRAQQILRDPRLSSFPDAEWIVGMQIEGERATAARKAAAKTAAESKGKPKAAAPKPASDQTAVSSANTAARVPVATGVKAALAAEQKKLSMKGGITTAEAIASLTNRERLRNSR